MGIQLLEVMPHPLAVAAMVGVMAWLGVANIRESWQILAQCLLSEESQHQKS